MAVFFMLGKELEKKVNKGGFFLMWFAYEI